MSLPWYLAGALALGCAGLGLWNYSQSATIEARDVTIKARDETIARKDEQIAQAKQTNSDKEAAIIRLRAERDAASAVSAKFDQLNRARDARFFNLLERITNGPAEEDGPVPRVLESALDGLREGAAGTDRSDGNEGGAGTDPARKAAVPGH